MAWKTPKTTWGQAGQTVPGADDFNRIEGNTQYLKDEIDTRMQVISKITYYVATTGNDNNSGTSNSPFKTIQKAVNEAYKAIAGRVRINIAPGTYTGDVEIENLMCPLIEFFGDNETNTTIVGDITITNAQWVRIFRLKLRDGIYGVLSQNGLHKLTVYDVIIENVNVGVYLANVEMAEIDSTSINANGHAIECRTVGNLRVKNVQISGVQTSGIRISEGSFAYTSGLTGNIGSVPVHSIHASLLIKGSSTITGGADTKSSGGQIFE